ncbi:SMI1/KNR4 family protein [Streptomyces sp. B6B3]|uniref:SMI1/KNR4 family protein n=1 Tax=Streptomyces sp. B6B3 TaxID=3153570 RepID=UPI00325EF61B
MVTDGEGVMVERVVRRIVEEIVASAPEGWTGAVLAGRVSRGGGSSVSGGYGVPGARHHHSVPTLHAELCDLGTALQEARGWDRANLEIQCLPSGEYRVVATPDAVDRQSGMRGGFQIVLDPDRRLPQPGFEQEGSTAAPAGDPRLAAERFRAYLERRAAILGRPDELPPPASAAALDEVERRIGRALPPDLRALYAIADGERLAPRPRRLFEGSVWMPLSELIAEYDWWREPPWLGWDHNWDSVVFDAHPADTVRRCGGHPDWIPFVTHEDGNVLAVDMAPARDGRPGQVIEIGRDHHDGPAYVADSVTSLLGGYLELLRQGAYELDNGHLDLLEPAQEVPRHQHIGGGIPEVVPPTLQAIHINKQPSPVDLAPLTAGRSLRRVHLNRCATADLTPLRSLPVESLRVVLDPAGDLTPLEGHRHLSSLALASAAPVDIAPLRTAPNLRGLDLAWANVRDLPLLADLPDLRYLSLNGRQWAVLLKANRVPPTLAAAHLGGDYASLDQALDWAAFLGTRLGEPFRATGTVGTGAG